MNKLLGICIMLAATTCSMVSYGYGIMSTHVKNQTGFELRMPGSAFWHIIYGSGAEFNTDPIPVGANPKVVTLEGDAFKTATRYEGSYDVYKADGGYRGTCSISVWGFPGDFISSQEQHSCSGGVSIQTIKMTGEGGAYGYYQLIVS